MSTENTSTIVSLQCRFNRQSQPNPEKQNNKPTEQYKLSNIMTHCERKQMLHPEEA